jgi:hypothetical protein
MTLRDNLTAVVCYYVKGAATLDDLQDWLTAHVQALADSGDTETRDLANDAWILLEEYSHRLPMEHVLRRELSKLVSSGT